MPTVLVIDDEARVRLLIRAYLAHWGYEVREAGDLSDALRLLAAQRIDLVITDLRLPGGNAIALLDQLQAAPARIPVIVVTGDPSADNAVGCLESGAAELLGKPIQFTQLAAVVHRCLGGNQAGSGLAGDSEPPGMAGPPAGPAGPASPVAAGPAAG